MKTTKTIVIPTFVKLAAAALLASLALSACNTGVVADRADEQPVRIAMRSNELAVVKTAVSLFASDVKALSDMDVDIVYDNFSSLDGKIFVATIGNSSTLGDLEAWDEISLSSIRGMPESFIVRSARLTNGAHVLFVVGSDPSGTAYGVMELSKVMGISPWERVKGSKVGHRQTIDFRGLDIVGIPPAKNRIFSGQDFPQEKLFELMLRTGGNTLVVSENAFDKKLAAKYGVRVVVEKAKVAKASETPKTLVPEDRVLALINACDYSNAYGRIQKLKGFGRCGMAVKMEKGVQNIFRFAHIDGRESAIFHFSLINSDGRNGGKARFAVSLDDGAIRTVEVDMSNDSPSAGIELPFRSKGTHKLTLISLTDGLILDQIVVEGK